MKELTEKEALNKAAAYCAASEHCISEVTDKLEQWGAEPDVRKRIIQRLLDEKYIDERRYAQCFINDKLRYNKWGRNKISQALWQKRLSPDSYAACLDAIDEDEYMRILRDLLSVRKKSVKARNDYELNGKLMRFALGRGFEMDVVRRCINLPEDEE